LAAAILFDDEAEALTRKAVELALAGDQTAMRLCLERILWPCRERADAAAERNDSHRIFRRYSTAARIQL
jgi:hypothetical protein